MMFEKFKEIAKKTATTVESSLISTVTSLKEEGLQATSYRVGQKIGETAKGIQEKAQDLQSQVTDYAQDIEKANKKATNPLGISFKKGTVSHSATKSVVIAINTMRIIGTDAKNKIEGVLPPKP